jgi:hypothetical protein
MKFFLLIFILSTGFNFIIKGQIGNDTLTTYNIKVDKLKDLDKLNLDFCKSFSIEITGLLPNLKVLPNLQDDSAIVKILLIKNGFKQVDWGSGNWEKGPRFIYLKYMKGNCTCKIYKKYYFSQNQFDRSDDLRISERIICNSDKFMDD